MGGQARLKGAFAAISRALLEGDGVCVCVRARVHAWRCLSAETGAAEQMGLVLQWVPMFSRYFCVPVTVRRV